MFIVVLIKVLPLLLAIGLGVLAGVLKLFPAPMQAVDTLNRYALYIGFPLLIFQGFCRPDLALSSGPGFYLFHGVMAVAIILCIMAMGAGSSSLREIRGSLVLGSLFGNVAYLGIPLGTLLLGPAQLGLISLSVALQVLLAMLLAPLFLLLWRNDGAKGDQTFGDVARALLRQPLLWAPVLGFLARLAPSHWLRAIAPPLSFFAASAAPVALFLLGLHIWIHRSSLRRLQVAVAGLVVSKLLLVPLLVVAIGGFFAKMGWMSPREWQVTLLLSIMPTAITTFSIARDMKQREGLMAQAILLSTLLALLLLPLVAPTLLQLAGVP